MHSRTVWDVDVNDALSNLRACRPADITFVGCEGDGEDSYLCAAGFLEGRTTLNGDTVTCPIDLPTGADELHYLGYVGQNSERTMTVVAATHAPLGPIMSQMAAALADMLTQVRSGPQDIFLSTPQHAKMWSVIVCADGTQHNITNITGVHDVRVIGDKLIGVDRRNCRIVMATASDYLSRHAWRAITIDTIDRSDIAEVQLGRPVMRDDDTVALPFTTEDGTIVGNLDLRTACITLASIKTAQGLPLGWMSDHGHFGMLHDGNLVICPPKAAPVAYPHYAV